MKNEGLCYRLSWVGGCPIASVRREGETGGMATGERAGERDRQSLVLMLKRSVLWCKSGRDLRSQIFVEPKHCTKLV